MEIAFTVTDLMQNPFVLLGTTPRSNKSALNEAFDDAMLDAHDVEEERRLNLARQALFTPNDRLAAELSYLLEVRPSEVSKALKFKSPGDWSDFSKNTEGVAKTNACIEIMHRSSNIDDVYSSLVELLKSWNEIDVDNVLINLQEMRAISGFGSVVRRDIEQGLDELRKIQAEVAITYLDKYNNLPEFFRNLIEKEIIPSDRMGDKFTAELIKAYSHKITGPLATAAERSLERLKSFVDSSSDDRFEDFERELLDWDRLAQPLQLASEIRGIDEVHSQELYESVRSFALNLANEEGRHDDAIRITRLAERVFAELPSATVQLREDVETLDEIIEHNTKIKALSPLIQAVTEARGDLLWTSKVLSSQGFIVSSPDPIGPLRLCFDNILNSDVPTEIRDSGAKMVRGLAVELFNEQDDVAGALAITACLTANDQWFSEGVCDQIAADNIELKKNFRMQQLQDAMKAQDWKSAKLACAQLLALSSGKSHDDILEIDRRIDEKIRSRRNSRIFWGIASAVIIYFMYLESNDTEPQYDYSEVADDVQAFDEGNGESTDSIASANDEGQPEIVPSVGGDVLTLPELRYCVRQEARLDAARGIVESRPQEVKFNLAVSDFNLRCGSFQYEKSDLAKVQSELTQLTAQLQADAIEIIGTKQSDVSPSYVEPDPLTMDDNSQQMDLSEPSEDVFSEDAYSPRSDPSGY